MLKLDFLGKGLRIVFPATFAYNFSTKMFLILYLLTHQISLPGCFYLLRYGEICVLQLFVNQVVTLWIFLIEPFFLHDQTFMTKLKYLENKCEIKSFFHHF